jgi:flagellar hook-basal body complex protein FliE
MVDNIAGKSGALRSASVAGPAPEANAAPTALAGGAAFQALLERLDNQARELEAQSRTIEKPADLSGAVDRAHASLQDALSLSDRLVEAYRQALTRAEAPAASGSGRAQGGKP